MKKGLMSILVCMLMFSLIIPVTSVGAEAEQGMVFKPVKFLLFNQDGSVTEETTVLSGEETLDVWSILSKLVERIHSAKDYNGVMQTLKDFREKQNNRFIQMLVNALMKRKPSMDKLFIVSYGSGYRFNPFKTSEFAVKKRFAFWHYSSKSPISYSSKTVMVDPYPFQMKVLNGWQLGMMRGFSGVYVYMPDTTSGRYNTFFVGFAAHARGMDLITLLS